MNYIRSTAAPCTTDQADEPVVVLRRPGRRGQLHRVYAWDFMLYVCVYVCMYVGE